MINDTSNGGWNSFHHSCFIGNSDIVEELLKLKADINMPTRDTWSPL